MLQSFHEEIAQIAAKNSGKCIARKTDDLFTLVRVGDRSKKH